MKNFHEKRHMKKLKKLQEMKKNRKSNPTDENNENCDTITVSGIEICIKFIIIYFLHNILFQVF